MRRFRPWIAAFAGAALSALAACASTDKPEALTHHVLLKAVDTETPMYIVGVEKYAASLVGRIPYNVGASCAGERCMPCDDRFPQRCIDLVALAAAGPPDIHGSILDLWKGRLDDRTQMIVSHIVRLERNGCAVVYASSPRTACVGPELAVSPRSVGDSWTAIEDDLYRALKAEIDDTDATHVVVMTTGWNTPQESSIGKFDHWNNGVLQGLGPGSRPVIVGLTWPADREGLPYIHFRNKAHDSDEVGLTWANLLVNRTLARLRAETGVRIVLIGHSFGARLLSTAAHSGAAVGHPCGATGGLDLLIGLQGAFSTSRFIGPRPPDALAYAHGPKCDASLVYASSTNDRAVAWAPSQLLSTNTGYMAGARALALTRESDLFVQTSTTPTGNVSPPPLHQQVLLVDASLITHSHTDVFNAETNVMIGDLIRRYSPRPASAISGPPVER